MARSSREGLVSLHYFIDAIRDAGYRGPGAALAELIDNAFEADATRVDISILERDSPAPQIVVKDDGGGMPPAVLRLALQFGGTTRFDSRAGVGRYGMGLPAGSLSQAQRVDVYTWTKTRNVWWSYLDVEEIRAGRRRFVPRPSLRPPEHIETPGPSGTIVIWTRCDRLSASITPHFESSLHAELGRIFRTQLWSGRTLTLNGEAIAPVDPLFLRPGKNLLGGVPYGPALRFHVEATDSSGTPRNSEITAQFVELPIIAWQSFGNNEKRAFGISKCSGISILRAGREIDAGWFFMGSKRKENYDDWWRCEVSFEPELDEFFGVNHTKQGIRPTETILRILTPDMARIAHELNRRVRSTFNSVKEGQQTSRAVTRAERRDSLLEPPPSSRRTVLGHSVRGWWRGRPPLIAGLTYRLKAGALDDFSFFEPTITKGQVLVILNQQHPFYEKVYGNGHNADTNRETIELLLLAAGRAEARLRSGNERRTLRRFREHWSNALVAFLG